ncbi:hypothetical protein PS2_000408 [Malus domestica]
MSEHLRPARCVSQHIQALTPYNPMLYPVDYRLRACMHMVSDSAPAVFYELVLHRQFGHSWCPGKRPVVPPVLSHRPLSRTRRWPKKLQSDTEGVEDL